MGNIGIALGNGKAFGVSIGTVILFVTSIFLAGGYFFETIKRERQFLKR